ncbi:hypothetical protein GCM10023329_41260 [Streptomyces sanyensis]|uniref:Uncharacterized protein n=1 Tax=Streptomyces sanyensis TaxID=568869 RepID=A0ABP9AWA4_9ACTN
MADSGPAEEVRTRTGGPEGTEAVRAVRRQAPGAPSGPRGGPGGTPRHPRRRPARTVGRAAFYDRADIGPTFERCERPPMGEPPSSRHRAIRLPLTDHGTEVNR